MYPHRAWDSGLDPQAGRGYGQQQPGQQAQGQNASGTWQDQVRGNHAAEYAALMQSRTADGTSGGVQGHLQFAGMQQMGMNQAMGEQGFGAGMMHGGNAPRGDPGGRVCCHDSGADGSGTASDDADAFRRAGRRYRMARSYDGSNEHEPWNVAE